MNEPNLPTPAAVLRTAAYHGDLMMLNRLIVEGVDVNVADQWKRTALSLASRRGHVKAVEMLLKAGAWVDPSEDYDTCETPLIAAAEAGQFEVVRVLVAAGADPRLHGGVSQATAAFYARNMGHTEISDFLSHAEDGGS